jgi:hypothetical protein
MYALDFGMLGQLHPMIALDKNVGHHSKSISPRVCSWYNLSYDLSGFSVADEEEGWLDTDQDIPDTLKALFQEVGSIHSISVSLSISILISVSLSISILISISLSISISVS